MGIKVNLQVSFARMGAEIIEGGRMRILLLVVLLFSETIPALAQNDKFPLVAKVVSHDTESVPRSWDRQPIVGPSTGATPRPPQNSSTRTARDPSLNDTEIILFAYIENRAYKLRSPLVLDPGQYPASIDKNEKRVRLLINDKNGKPKTIKLDVLEVAAKR